MTWPVSARLLLPLALVGASCGELVEPEAFTMATSTSVVDAESGASSVDAPPRVPTTLTAASDFVPSRSSDYIPEVLITTSQAILAAGPTGVYPLTEPFTGLRTSRAVDDLLGGLVYQRPGSEGAVVWLSAEGEELEVAPGEGATLLDVGYIDGSPSAVVLLQDGQIDQIRLVDSVRSPLMTLDEEEEVLALSASGSLHAIAIANEDCGDLRFYTADGSMIDLNGPDQPACPVPRRPTYGSVALSPDGGAIVYTVVSYREDGIEVQTDLVARELSTGSDYFRISIGDEGDQVTGLSFDGERVAVLHRSAEDETSVSVLDLVAIEPESPVQLQGVVTIGSISFARLPLAQG